MVQEYRRNRELKEKLVNKTKIIVDMSRKLERKDCIIAEKEQQCEELEGSMSRLQPASSLAEDKWKIREQKEHIKALQGNVHMSQLKTEQYKNENEKLADKFTTNRKLYLRERRKNMDLVEASKKSGVEQPAEDKSGDTQPSISSNVLQKQSNSHKERDQTRM